MNGSERLRGGVVGALVGDALGVPYEFQPPSALPPRHQIEPEPPPGFRRAHAGTPVGTWSDDGAQALALLTATVLQPLQESGPEEAAPDPQDGLVPLRDYGGDVPARTHLSGDWAGRRTDLSERGIQLRLRAQTWQTRNALRRADILLCTNALDALHLLCIFNTHGERSQLFTCLAARLLAL